MLSHKRIWAAIDALAERNDLSPSGLAKRAGLDSTTFNKSKRHAADGRARWPSTESLAKVMEATGATLDEFVALIDGPLDVSASFPPQPATVPVLGMAQAGAGGFFDDGGFPAGQGWDMVEFPTSRGESTYALQVAGDSMLPLYRDGDVIIVSPGASVHRGDRVVLRTRGGEVMAKILARQTSRRVEVSSLNPEHPNRSFDVTEIDWIARIIWASQ